ncbi:MULTISPECIES: cytochrome P450 [Amycolatopsis]|uniref:Cytochrome P450 n=1 Tax=Amycolatopsis tucumanensis TaxID=401106 RepID=A0ABP7IVP3_9PSEU|nr:cytochrome P450 [Amycolatopsis tucumanensis]MCF6424166.1 cytochrome P450 [Amycolatopsis tucumanensis]
MTIAPVPHTEIDLFSDTILTDPYPAYATLRASGAAVYLDKIDAWALPRYEHIRAALRDWETFSSDAAVGLNDVVNGFLVGTVLGTDPPQHDTLRSVLSEQLAPRALRKVKDDIEASAGKLVDALVTRGEFDAVTDLAAALPLSVVFDLIGLPERARDDMLRWADGTFTVFGPMNERTEKGLGVIQEMFAWLGTLRAEDLKPGSMGRAIFDAADAGQIGHDSCVPLLAAYTTAGMDTTINAIANSIQLFATHPDQWDALRANPDFIPSAFNEVLRYDAPVQAFARKITRDVTVDDTHIPSGAQVVLLYGSGNRDERQYPDPDSFDIQRNPVDHLAFGYGTHTCAGQALAKIEAHAILRALAARVRRIHVGEATRHLNNVIRGLESLPVVHLETDD